MEREIGKHAISEGNGESEYIGSNMEMRNTNNGTRPKESGVYRATKRTRRLKRESFASNGYVIKTSKMCLCIELDVALWSWTAHVWNKWYYIIPKNYGCVASVQAVNSHFEITIKPTHGITVKQFNLCQKEVEIFLQSLPTMYNLYIERLPTIYFVPNLPNSYPEDTFICEDNESVLVIGTNRGHVGDVANKLRETRGNGIGQIIAKKRKRAITTLTGVRNVSSHIGATYKTSGTRIHVLEGDITKLRVQAVVNAANGILRHGGGIAGAINKAAGPELQRVCNRYIRDNGALSTSEVYTTDGYRMPCQHIIHVVGPRWSDYKSEKEARRLLLASFKGVLEEAESERFTSIAIPAVSSGIYGAPLTIVADLMFKAVLCFADNAAYVKDIILVDVNTHLLHILIKKSDDAVSNGKLQRSIPNFKHFLVGPINVHISKTDLAAFPYNTQKGDSNINSLHVVAHKEVPKAARAFKGGALKKPAPPFSMPLANDDISTYQFIKAHKKMDKGILSDSGIEDLEDHTIENHTGLSYEASSGIRIHIYAGDITSIKADVVVNSTTERLDHSMGVSGAISKVAGPELQRITDKYIQENGPLSTSQIYTTEGFNMPCKFIVHVVSPRWGDSAKKKAARQSRSLSCCYRNVLLEADRLGVTSLAIPAIGAGIHKAPLQRVADVMFDEVHGFVKAAKDNTDLRDIIFVDINTELLQKLNGKFNDANTNKWIQAIKPSYKCFVVSSNDVNSHHKPKLSRRRKLLVNCDDRSGRTQADKIPSIGYDNGSEADSGLGEAKVPESQMKGKGRRQKLNHTGDVYLTSNRTLFEAGSFKTRRIISNYSAHCDQPMESEENPPAPSMPSTSIYPKEEEKHESCAICMESPRDRKELSVCKHVFCKECIDNWFQTKPMCPNCGMLYGELTGDQPDGTMKTQLGYYRLQGFECSRGTIEIKYDFPGGYQKECHPNPGKPYHGITRVAYLPDNPEGRHVLSLLRRAFDARLIFTIGRSTTTGREDQITWNDIHHKTNRSGGPDRFGYPDPTYLSRISEELAAKGIK